MQTIRCRIVIDRILYIEEHSVCFYRFISSDSNYEFCPLNLIVFLKDVRY
jgi:hypothetical protein